MNFDFQISRVDCLVIIGLSLELPMIKHKVPGISPNIRMHTLKFSNKF